MSHSPAPIVLLGHGASGTAASMRPYVEGLERRGVEARAIDLPRGGKAERAVPVFAAQLPDDRPVVVGGHSFGGRVSSLLAAERRVAGVVMYSYPLHRPGDPEGWEARVAHWPSIPAPVLIFEGEADSFARIELLRAAMDRLPAGDLTTYPGQRHGLRGAALEDALDRTAAFVLGLGRVAR
jgi:hypothetical protein